MKRFKTIHNKTKFLKHVKRKYCVQARKAGFNKKEAKVEAYSCAIYDLHCYITKLKLAAVHQSCDAEDKSTEYMYQLMQDIAKVDIDTVNNYMTKENHTQLLKELNELVTIIVTLSETKIKKYYNNDTK